MKRAKEGTSFLVYKYRCYPKPCDFQGNHWRPTDEMLREAFRMRDYWNKLVDLADQNRDKYFAILERDSDLKKAKEAFEEAKASHSATWAALRSERKFHRTRKFPQAESFEEAVKRSKEQLKIRLEALKEANVKARENKKKDLDQLKEEWAEILRQERKENVMGWGNREFILDHFKTAAFVARGSKAELRKKGFIDQMNFTQPYTSGKMKWSLFKNSHGKRVHISELHEAKSRQQAPRYDWDFMIDRDVSIPIQVAYSRPIPDEAIVRSVTLHGERIQRSWMRKINLNNVLHRLAKKASQSSDDEIEVYMATYLARWWQLNGQNMNDCHKRISSVLQNRERESKLADDLHTVLSPVLKEDIYVTEAERWQWTVHVALEVQHAAPTEDRAEKCAINIGWAKIGDDSDEVRAAMAIGSDGKRHELRLPKEMIRQHRYTRDLNAVLSGIDNNFAKELEMMPLVNIKGEAREAIAAAIKETNVRTLMNVFRLLSEHSSYRDILRDWYTRRSHLANMINGNYRRLRNWRTNIYRNWARMLCLSYNQILVGDMDIKKMAEDGEKDGRLQASMRYRQIVGPSFLVVDLKNMAKKLMVEVKDVKVAKVSITCPTCTMELDEKTGERIVLCPNGHMYDVDEGACLNHLKEAA